MKDNFKFGDKVRITKTGTHEYTVGEEVYLLNNYSPEWDQFNTSRTLNGLQVGCGWVKPSEIELVERYEYVLVPPEQLHTLKVGDKIKIRGEENEVINPIKPWGFGLVNHFTNNRGHSIRFYGNLKHLHPDTSIPIVPLMDMGLGCVPLDLMEIIGYI